MVFYTLVLVAVNYILPIIYPIGNTVSASSITSTTLIEYANLDRQNEGMVPLRNNAKLAAAAHEKAQDMLSKDYWDHFGPNGETPWQFIKAAGYDPYQYAGENLAKGFSTAEGVHEAWMASPSHRANIMDSNYSDIGIAVVTGQLGQEYVTLVVQMFGTLQGDTYALSSGTVTQVTEEIPHQYSPSAGEISSIKIIFPEEGSTLTNPQMYINGELQGDPDSSINIRENDDLLGTATVTGEEWSFTGDYDWGQGEHNVDVEVGTIEESVSFAVDSVGPILNNKNVLVNEEDGRYQVTYYPEEEVEAFVSTAGSSYILESNSESSLTAYIPAEDVSKSQEFKVVAVDSHGNESELYLEHDSENALVMGIVDSFNDPVGLFNIAFVGFILLLLGFQIYGYKKLNVLHHSAEHLFSFGIWGIIITIGLITKNVGSIN